MNSRNFGKTAHGKFQQKGWRQWTKDVYLPAGEAGESDLWGNILCKMYICIGQQVL